MINYFNEKSLHQIDQKGRLLLPRDVRSFYKLKKGESLFLVPSLASPPYLEIRTKKDWDAYRQALRADEGSETKKNTFRYAMMTKEEVKIDGQGRLLIPSQIRDTCDLVDKVAIINMETYIEVWCKEHVEKKYAEMVRAFKETNDRMF